MDVDSLPLDGGREQDVLKEDEEAAQGPAFLLSVSFVLLSIQTGTKSLDQGCVALVPALCSFSPSAATWTSQAKTGTHLYLSGHHRAQQPYPNQILSPQSCDHDSEFISWTFSQINMPVTYPWGLKNTFQPIFPYHHTLPQKCLSGIHIVRLHIPNPHQEQDCIRTFQLF